MTFLYTVLHYGGYQEEQTPEREYEQELKTHLPDQEPVTQAGTTTSYLSSLSSGKPLTFSTSPESVEATMEDLNFQKAEFESFDAAARIESGSIDIGSMDGSDDGVSSDGDDIIGELYNLRMSIVTN